MRLSINGVAFDVPPAFLEKVMSDLLVEGEKDYKEKVPVGWRIAGQAVSRMILQTMEQGAAKQIGREAARELLRPKNREDPNLLLAKVFSRVLLKGMGLVDVYICTDEDSRTIDTFNFTIEQGAGEAGQRVDFDGSQGERENNGAQIP